VNSVIVGNTIRTSLSSSDTFLTLDARWVAVRLGVVVAAIGTDFTEVMPILEPARTDFGTTWNSRRAKVASDACKDVNRTFILTLADDDDCGSLLVRVVSHDFDPALCASMSRFLYASIQ